MGEVIAQSIIECWLDAFGRGENVAGLRVLDADEPSWKGAGDRHYDLCKLLGENEIH